MARDMMVWSPEKGMYVYDSGADRKPAAPEQFMGSKMTKLRIKELQEQLEGQRTNAENS